MARIGLGRSVYVRKREGLCIPTRRCIRQTPVGEVEGMECPPNDVVYHNTLIGPAKKIAEDGKIRIEKREALGQDAISFSSCPSQRFGGNIKLVVETKGLHLRPMCYYDHEKEKDVDRWIGSQHDMNRVRAKYAVDAAVLHMQECENISYDPVPAKAIKKVEYWIPWRVEDSYPNVGCEGAMPHYSFSERFLSDPVGKVHENIAEAKKVADKLGARFEVKSCFTALKTGWGDQYIPLNDRNLKMLEKGKTPTTVKGKVPELCRC